MVSNPIGRVRQTRPLCSPADHGVQNSTPGVLRAAASAVNSAARRAVSAAWSFARWAHSSSEKGRESFPSSEPWAIQCLVTHMAITFAFFYLLGSSTANTPKVKIILIRWTKRLIVWSDVMRVLVLGGSRFMGRFMVRHLLAAGQAVTCLNRGTMPPVPGSQTLVGDRNDPETWLQIRPDIFDAVIDMSAYTPEQSQMALSALAYVPRFVHLSTGAVYRPNSLLPWKEDDDLGPWGLWGTYAQNKLHCEQVILNWQRDHKSNDAVIMRVAMVLGPANYVDREEFVLNRILDNETILIPGEGEALFSVVSARQVGISLAKAATKPLPAGVTIVNVGSPLMTSGLGFVDQCGKLLGRQPKVRLVGNSPIGIAEPVFDATNCVFPFPNANYVLDCTRSVDLGIDPPVEKFESWLQEALDALLADPHRRQWHRTQAETFILESK